MRNTLVTLLILFCFILIVFPKVSLANAQGAITIQADGTIEGTDKIVREGNMYTFLENITVNSIVVERDDIVIDGSNYSLHNVLTSSQLDSYGIVLSGRSNVTVKNLQILNFNRGFDLKGCSNIDMLGNYIYVNSPSSGGIYLFSCYRINIIENAFISKSALGCGVLIDNFYLRVDSVRNFLLKNKFSNLGCAIHNIASTKSTLSGNTFSNCGTCVFLDSCEYDKIFGNVFENSQIGLKFNESSNNTIYHNNFLNIQQDVTEQESSMPWLEKTYVNSWDNGSEGNYWSSYNGADNNGDGIGEVPYVLTETNQDNYPLTNPVNINIVSIPEYPELTLLTLFLAVTLLVIIYNKRTVH
ncbi:MAG: right-handed parallel beta-helix repeat-containing protein [archaeon]|nr:right-handed parallel beta-helix repeat-containing protein [Candidatus Bathyarchaeum sp.]